MSSANSPLSSEELTSAVELLKELIPKDDFPAYSHDVSPRTVYTTLVTLWMLTLQRLGGGKSLTAIVKDVLQYSRDIFPNNKRVRTETLSENSTSYSRARKRLPLEAVVFLANRVSDSLIERSPAWYEGRRAYIIDGTTMTLSPTSSLQNAYPPATNQFGETVWPVMMLMVANELQSGCALVPEFGSMYGSKNTSEARQAAATAGRIPKGSLVLADANFGIFSVAHSMIDAEQDILFRLTTGRFKALSAKSRLVKETRHWRSYRLNWKPSSKERRNNPDLPADASIEVTLHAVRLDNGEWLYLVTTLKISSQTAAKLYRRRYDVEHDIRDMKVTLGIENIRAKSDEMVQKELLCSVVAYNLVVQLRRQAAKIANVPPRRLSFTQVWTTMQTYLLQQPPCSATEWEQRYEKALRSASKAKLPNRPGRTFPRKAHPRRAKSTKFTKQQAKEKAKKQPKKPK